MHDASDSSRPAVLPMALVGVLGLLAGFGGGYFIASRDHGTPEGAAPTATAATHDRPGQYSEQKVGPPPPSTAPAQSQAGSTAKTQTKPVEPPPVVQELPPARQARPDQAAASAPHEPATAHTTGTLIIKSSPSKAGVTVNTKWRGRTPLTLDRMPFGRYVVRIVQPGYKVAQEEFTLGPRAASHTFSARLEPTPSATARHEPAAARPAEKDEPAVPYVGTLFVDSRPRGASVLLDGKNIGVTPLTLDNVAVGSHVVKIEMTGKRPWSSSTRVAAGETARVTGSLEDK
jgi:hypothetical protein